MSLAQSLAELLFPVRCVSCSALGIKLCSQCRTSWIPHIYTTVHSRPEPFRIYSAVQYSAIGKRILIASKEAGVVLADSLVTEALGHSITFALQHEWVDFLVPIPSRKSVTRSRGRSYIKEISQPISEQYSIPIFDMLSHTRKIRDQSGLHSDERFRNLDGALMATRRPLGKALLVDDLVTTGATLLEARRALVSAGVEVTGAITACIAQSVSQFSL